MKPSLPLPQLWSLMLLPFLLLGCGDHSQLSLTPVTPPPPPPPGNLAPTPRISVGDSVVAGQPLAFDGSASSDPEGGALLLNWDFADGQHGGGARIAHVFSAAGRYRVRLTATDPQGASASLDREITVTAAPAAARNVAVRGKVSGLDGAALSGVSVSVQGGGSAETAADGSLSLMLGVGVPQTLRFAKAGYALQVLSLNLPNETGSDAEFSVVMLPQQPALTLADAAAGGTLSGKDGARIQLPAGALVKADGSPVTGAVRIAMTPVDITQPRSGGFPGRFEGINADTARLPLVSLGTTEFALSQDGAPVQVAPGQQAEILLPVYADRRLDGSPFAAGDRIPLWSLDEQSGAWINEGEGVLEAAAGSPTGLAMRARVGHFSWWNSDMGFEVRTPKPKLKCVYDDDIGLPGSRDTFAQATLCKWLAELDRGIPEQKAAGAKAAATARLPGFSAETLIPVDGAALDLPAAAGLRFSVSALNGSFVGSGSLPAGNTGQTELVVKMRPVQAQGEGGEDISLPFDGSRKLPSAGAVSRLNFDAQGFRWLKLSVEASADGGSALPRGSLRLFKGDAPLLVYPELNTGSQPLIHLLPDDGRYTLELVATEGTPATARIRIEQVGSDQDETLSLPFSNLNRFPEALTTLRLHLPITAARTLYLTSLNTESRMRLIAPDGQVLFNSAVGSPQQSVPDERSLRMSGTGTAVLQLASLDGNPPSLRLGAALSHWLPVTPLLDGYGLVDLVADRAGGALVLLVRQTGSGSDARFALSLRRQVDGGWQPVGPELGDLRLMTGSTGGVQAAVAFDSDNRPLLLYGLDTTVTTPGSTISASQFVARRLTGEDWQPLGNDTGLVSSERVGSFARPKLLVDSQARPLAGLPLSNGAVLVTVLVNGRWRALSDPDAAGDRFNGDYFDLANENNGRVYLATAPRSGSGTVVRRFTPDSIPAGWQPVGPNDGRLPQPAGESASFAPRIALDANDDPIVAGSSQRYTAVWRFDGSQWRNGAASRISSSDFAGAIEGYTLLGARALLAYSNTTVTSAGSYSRPVVQANDAADSTSGLGDNGGAVVQFVPSFAYNRTGSGQRLLTVGGEVYQAIQASSQMQLLRLTE